MKIFQVLLLSMLLLIFGALLGIFISLDNYYGEEAIILDHDELEELGIPFIPTLEALDDEYLVSSSFNIYNLDGFRKYLRSDEEDIINTLEVKGFQLEFEEEEIATYSRYEKCYYSSIHNSEVCKEEFIHVNIPENEVIVEILTYLEGDEDE